MKKNGTVCIDFAGMNRKTLCDSYPLPRMEACFQALKVSKCFSTFDFYSGYLQIPLRERDKEKTAFRVSCSYQEFERIPFRLQCSPDIF